MLYYYHRTELRLCKNRQQKLRILFCGSGWFVENWVKSSFPSRDGFMGLSIKIIRVSKADCNAEKSLTRLFWRLGCTFNLARFYLNSYRLYCCMPHAALPWSNGFPETAGQQQYIAIWYSNTIVNGYGGVPDVTAVLASQPAVMKASHASSVDPWSGTLLCSDGDSGAHPSVSLMVLAGWFDPAVPLVAKRKKQR